MSLYIKTKYMLEKEALMASSEFKCDISHQLQVINQYQLEGPKCAVTRVF